MSADISYTTEEIAKLLKISKLTVYDLIKKGDLPSYRVGKQMPIDASDLEAYKLRQKVSKPVRLPARQRFPSSKALHTRTRWIYRTETLPCQLLAGDARSSLPDKI